MGGSSAARRRELHGGSDRMAVTRRRVRHTTTRHGDVMQVSSSSFLVRAAVAAALTTGYALTAMAAEPAAAVSEDKLEEVVLTGSRIVRRDTESTSPLVTVEKEVLEKSSYISIEQALNELPQFMAGGALNGAGAVTGLTAAGDVMGGAGTGNMFDTARPVDNARAGQYTPGAATVNLRGLGPNRNIVLIDGRRGVPTNASGAIDLNTVPQIAIGNIEVITGGASSVYGADALAGVTNIRLRDNFNGVEVRARGGINEAGGEYAGQDRFAARKAIVARAEEEGWLRGIEKTRHVVPHGDRSGVVIEPWLTDQWYVDAATLAKPAIAAVEQGDTVFEPRNWDKTYFEWMRNIEPWCISRQLWWGHRIPAWYDEDGKVYVEDSLEAAQAAAGDRPLRQDEDVLDTWFSSALWPFSTMGWPEQTRDLERFYPTHT
ncbi:MAG: hypothetical protein EOP08_03320, partial [Proteobacteria bacterium]